MYGINGDVLFKFDAPSDAFPDGKWSIEGSVAGDGNPAYMIANGVTNANQQIFISSVNHGYILVPDVTFVDLSTLPGFIAGQGAAFLDNYFVSIIPGTNGFQVSALNDGLTWDPLAVAYMQGQSDNLVNLIADREYLWLFGSRRSEIWYNAGTSPVPFAIQPGAFMECGLGAQASLVQADNTLFWIGQDKRGGLSAWRANGFNPLRITNHAVEYAWARYSTVADCTAYAFLWRGHTFVRFIFPTAQAGWTYDCAASQMLGYPVWHENTFTDGAGNTLAPLERTHAYFQGAHVVGSGGADDHAGALWEFTDNTTIAVDPVVQLRWSDDGGNTYGPELQIPVGRVGEYEKRVIANLLGSGRDRVFWVRCVDYGDGGGNLPITGQFPIIRDRICPHLSSENKRIFYKRLELEVQRGIGFEVGATTPLSGVVTTAAAAAPYGTVVTWVSGDQFSLLAAGDTITVNGTVCIIAPIYKTGVELTVFEVATDGAYSATLRADDNTTAHFWALINAYLTIEVGET